MIDVQKLNNQIFFGGNNVEYKRFHVSVPKELYNIISSRYPYGTRSRMVAQAIIERLQKLDRAEYQYLKHSFHTNLLKNTDWDEVFGSYKNYVK